MGSEMCIRDSPRSVTTSTSGDVECPSRDREIVGFPPRLPVPNRRLIETGKLFTNSNLELRCIHTKYACGSSAEGARDEKKNRTAACRRTAPPKGSHHTRRRRRKAPGTSQAETSHARLAQGARSARTDRNRRRLSTRRAGRRDRPASIGPPLSDAAAAAFIPPRTDDRGGDGAKRCQNPCLLYTSPSPRDGLLSRMPSSA